MKQTKTITQALPADKEADQPLLVANLGNTHLRLVGFAGDRRLFDQRVPTAEVPGHALPPAPGLAIVLVSVVPAIAEHLLAHWGRERVYVLTAQDFAEVAYEPPAALGPDRLANALYLRHHHGAGVVVDAGTATTFTVVDAAGAIGGGAIMPGLGTAAASLHARTALLPEVPLEPVSTPWGRSTREAIQLGLLEGHVGAIARLVSRMQAALPEGAAVLLTGGWSGLLAPMLPEPCVRVPDLTIEGARLAWLQRNCLQDWRAR